MLVALITRLSFFIVANRNVNLNLTVLQLNVNS